MSKSTHTRIGNYFMFTNKKVAKLAYSTVYAGMNSETRKTVLVKVIALKEYQNNDVVRNSLDFEITVSKNINSKNVLKIIEVIESANNIYIILEEPQGVSFKKIISKSGAQPEKEVKNYMRKMFSTFE